MRSLIFLLLPACCIASIAEAQSPASTGPRTPQASLAAIHVPAGFRVELVAAEPLVQDPVAIAWGPDGTLWVAEMADYPMGLDDKGKPGGRIRRLSDRDGDGKLDESTLFAEGLRFPNGVMPWRNGVLITAAPDILWAVDENGDGRADKIEPLFTGFGEGNQQLRVNGLRYGMDGWIYGANGWSGGNVKSVRSGEALDLGGRGGPDFRLDPDRGHIQPVTGTSQFGRVPNDWGDWFGCDNSHLIWHVNLPLEYLSRNPGVLYPPSRNQLVLPKNPPVYPRSRLQQRLHADYMANRFTSACGLAIYRDKALFPDSLVEEAFTCEPVHNCISRRQLRRNGLHYEAARAPDEEKSEFLASEDNWARFVQARTGPDGALWVVDMYREQVEHPEWVPQDKWAAVQDKIDLRAGHPFGRIYRVVRTHQPAPRMPDLAALDTAGRVQALNSTNGEIRDLAQQLLTWEPDPVSFPLLRNAATQAPLPQARIHALHTLRILKQLDAALILESLQSAHPQIRRHALALAETVLPDPPEAFWNRLKTMTTDSSAMVRQQLAFSLGAWSAPQAGEILGSLATQPSDDIQTAALLSSAGSHVESLITHLVASASVPSPLLAEQLLTLSARKKQPDLATRLLQRAVDSPAADSAWRYRIATAWMDQKLPEHPALARLRESAGQCIQNPKSGEEETLWAVRFLGHKRSGESDKEFLDALWGLLSPSRSETLQIAALRAALTRSAGPTVLLDHWQTLLPAVREAAIDALLERKDWTLFLVESIRSGRIPAAQIDSARRERLKRHVDPALKSAAVELFQNADQNRQKTVEEFTPALDLPADSKRGHVVFQRVCISCHQLDNLGKAIGPDLRSVTDRSPTGLLVAILDPNRSVEPRYFSYLIQKKDGSSSFGLISEQDAGSLTLLGLDGLKVQIPRSDIAAIQSVDRSLMPDGLEAAMTRQELTDLIRYLGYPSEN